MLLVFHHGRNLFLITRGPKPIPGNAILLCPSIPNWGSVYAYSQLAWFCIGRKECACNPVLFFAILSMQRSGSGWFETLLNSHINISSNGEIFSVKERRSNISAIVSTLDEVYNLDWFSSASKNECSAAVGFKWMLNQVKYWYSYAMREFFRHLCFVTFIPLYGYIAIIAKNGMGFMFLLVQTWNIWWFLLLFLPNEHFVELLGHVWQPYTWVFLSENT